MFLFAPPKFGTLLIIAPNLIPKLFGIKDTIPHLFYTKLRNIYQKCIIKVSKSIMITQSRRFQPNCVFILTKIDHFFHHLEFTESSGSETPDFHFEDLDSKLIISDPEHFFMIGCLNKLVPVNN